MRRRLYYVMPDLASARKVMDDLLLARIEERHIHFLAKRNTPMAGLHEANVLQKTDLVHGAQLGLVLGALLGCGFGALLVIFVLTEPPLQIVTVLGATLGGALLGTWVSSMVGSAVPNSRLKQFDPLIEAGKILLMVDLPEHKVEQIKALLDERHPEAVGGGSSRTFPPFRKLLAEEFAHAIEPVLRPRIVQARLLLVDRLEFPQQFLLTRGQVDRRLDCDVAKEIAVHVGAHALDPLAAQPKHLSGLRLGRDLDLRVTVQRRDFDFSPQRRGREADRHLAVQIVVLALEHGVRLQLHDDIQVARRAAV